MEKNKSIYFLYAERFSVWQDKKRFLTEENIREICNRDNWTQASLEQVKKHDYLLMPGIYDYKDDEPQKSPEEIKQEVQSLAKELKQTLAKIANDWKEIENILENLEKDPEFYNKE